MSSVDLLLREAEAHEYFAENADLRMTTGDHAKRAANIRAIAAALREQPEARGVVDAEKLARLISEWELHDRTFGHDGRHPLIADFRAILTAAQQPVQEGGGVLCPRCKGAGEYEGLARHASGDPQDEYAATVQCEPCEGTGEVAAPPSAPVGVEGYFEWIKAVARELVALGFSPEAAQLFASAEAAEYERGECDCAENDPKDMVDLFMGTASHIVKKWEKESAGRLYGHKPEALAQQPAQAAPGMMLVQRVDIERLINATHLTESARLSARRLQALLLDTPPGDDAAGGGS